ncbi:MAG: hypothetical protein H0W72_03900 [Planctomycetes bacterium]|nr:hypothetical protein [Planctomycetota bacterium]
MHRIAVIAVTLATLATLAPTGTAEESPAAPAAPAPAAPAAVAVPQTHTEGGMFKPFYGEITHENRIYLFGSKAKYQKFQGSLEADPLKSKTFIGKGPNRMTVVAETDKDAPTMTERLVAQMRKRYDLQ